MPPSPPSPPLLKTKATALPPLIILLILTHLSTVLYTLPLNRVIEARLCQAHYGTSEGNPVPEKMCKIDEVQKRLAWVQGGMELTGVVCDFLITIPLSFIASRWGVKVVLWLNLVPRIGMSLWAILVGRYTHFFPVNAFFVGPFLNILGGECVFQSTIYTLTSALATEFVERASYFSYISSTSYVVSFLGPTLAAYTMSRNLWLPFWINIALLTCAITLISVLPDTRKAPLPSIHAEEEGPLLPDGQHSPDRYANAFETPKSPLQSINHAARKMLHLMTGRRNFQVLLCSFFLTALASSDTKLLVQYISKRYDRTFAEAGYMLSAKALVNFTLLALLIPHIIHSATSSTPSPASEFHLNRTAAIISILVSVLGVICVAFASKLWILLASLIVYALGSALPVFTMSLVKSPYIALADSEIQDFSIVMLTKTLGSLVGAPFMTVLWVNAIRLGGVGLGLPYFVSACIYVVAALVVVRLRI